MSQAHGMRKNGKSAFYHFRSGKSILTHASGKQWHGVRTAFRPTAGQTSYAKRAAKTQELAVTKAHEKELREEKEAERQVRIVSTLCTLALSDSH